VNWPVSIRHKAKADLLRAYNWDEGQRPGLGDEFLAAQAEALLRLEADPKRYPVYYRGFRRVLTHRFPYKLFYRIEGQDIILFRILHGAQDHLRKLP